MTSKTRLNQSTALHQIITIALMAVSFYAIFFSEIESGYKITIAILVFTIIILANIANQILKYGIPKNRF
jgi:hypothetical protein